MGKRRIHGDMDDMKSSLDRSGITVSRYRPPVSKLALYNTQFVHDYKTQKPVIPAGGRICRATVVAENKGRDTTNRSGRTAALGDLQNAFLGSIRRGSGPF